MSSDMDKLLDFAAGNPALLAQFQDLAELMKKNEADKAKIDLQQAELDELKTKQVNGNFQELHPGDEIGNYTILEILGEGSFATVFLAQDMFGTDLFAIKRIPLKDCNPEMFDDLEIDRLFQVGEHPNINRVLDVFDLNGYRHIVLDYVGPSLDDLLHEGIEFTPEATHKIIDGVIFGLRHLHGCNIIHSDIKPANICVAGYYEGCELSECTFVIIDLGGGHTNEYTSPELATCPSKPSQKSCDFWAFGCVLYEVITGKRLLNNVGRGRVVNERKYMKEFNEINGKLSQLSDDYPLRDIRKLLSPNPVERIH